MSHHKIFPLLLQGPFNLCVIILHLSGWIHMNEISEKFKPMYVQSYEHGMDKHYEKSVLSPAMFTFVQIL